ncbi:MAG: hypothetical protein U0414_29190 [Polyangiaceae bacterium]
MSAQAFERVTLDHLTIEDANAFKHVALFAELKEVLLASGYRFRVPTAGRLPWDRAVFLNLAYWSDAEGGDVLVDRTIPADVVMHVAWHHLASARLERGEDAELLGEAIASAFDMYLVGRLLGHSAGSTFLETQVPAMADAAHDAGLDEDAMERLLDDVASDPDRAFEDLRALLFETTRELTRAEDADAALRVLERRRGHRFGALLHHYERASWVANARARRAMRKPEQGGATASELHETLTKASSSVEWLRENWVARGVDRGE